MPIELVTLTPSQALGIPIALVGSVFLALGAQFQHSGVTRWMPRRPPRPGRSQHRAAAVARPSPVVAPRNAHARLAIVCQLWSLTLAPLTVVQTARAWWGS
ncbi:MAG: hypothetical protein WDM88_13005 [Galbitalea sp.]